MGTKVFAPKTVSYKGVHLLKRGFSSVIPGGYSYGTGSGWKADFVVGKVVSTGEHYSLVEMIGGGKVKVNHLPRSLGVGDYVLCGPVSQTPHGLTAESAWRVTLQKTDGRKTGTVYKLLSERAGFARNGDGTEVLVHTDSFLDPVLLLTQGDRISYKEVATQKGMKAVEIRWA
jgi:cold shock CspA family protein